MENHTNCQTRPFVLKKKNKKKPKDEMERLKQAEKKKRRLEKALATSAAIRFELEKKKQKKREQQRLDEEGAAIAESVALHVLADEDADDTVQLMLNRSTSYDHVDDSSSNSFFVDHQGFKRSSLEGLECECDAYGSVFKWNDSGIGYPTSPEGHRSNYQVPLFEVAGHGKELSPGFIAAEALSTLHIAESSYKYSFSGRGTETVVLDRIMGSNHLHDEVNFYNEY